VVFRTDSKALELIVDPPCSTCERHHPSNDCGLDPFNPAVNEAAARLGSGSIRGQPQLIKEGSISLLRRVNKLIERNHFNEGVAILFVTEKA